MRQVKLNLMMVNIMMVQVKLNLMNITKTELEKLHMNFNTINALQM